MVTDWLWRIHGGPLGTPEEEHAGLAAAIPDEVTAEVYRYGDEWTADPAWIDPRGGVW